MRLISCKLKSGYTNKTKANMCLKSLVSNLVAQETKKILGLITN